MVDFITMAAQAGGALMMVLIALFFIGAIVLIYITLKKRKIYSKYKVIVWKRYKNKEGQTISILEDKDEKGGVIKDKKMNKWVFHLKNANLDLGEEELRNFDENRTLDIPSLPYSKGGEVVFVEKVGNKKYAFGQPFVINGNVEIQVSEADLAEAKRSYALFVKTFGKKQNPLWAFGMYVIFAVLILVLIFVVLNKFELIVEASRNFASGAEAVGKGSAVPSGVP